MQKSDLYTKKIPSMELSSRQILPYDDSKMFNSDITIGKEYIISFDIILN